MRARALAVALCACHHPVAPAPAPPPPRPRGDAIAPGWTMVREAWSTYNAFQSGNGQRGELVWAGAPAKVACAIYLSAYSCNSEHGWCESIDVGLLPVAIDAHGVAAFTVRTFRNGGPFDALGAPPSCTRVTLTPAGACDQQPIACP